MSEVTCLDCIFTGAGIRLCLLHAQAEAMWDSLRWRDDMAYNGWTNYETWNVALWIDNDPGTYEERRDLARRARSVEELAGSLKSWVEDMAPDLGASMFSDLLGAALGEVDWYEIAENWYEEAHEDDEEEEEAEA